MKRMEEEMKQDKWDFTVDGCNRFQKDYENRLKLHSKCSDYLQKDPLILNVNNLKKYNLLGLGMVEQELCEGICETNNENYTKLWIPQNVYGVGDIGDSRGSAFICGDNLVYGIILFDCFDAQYNKFGDTQCVSISIRGRGIFYNTFNLTKCDTSTIQNGTSFNRLHEQYLHKDTQNTLRFDKRIDNHKIGYVFQSLEHAQTGDIIDLNAKNGLCISPSTKYYCGWCHISKNERLQSPTPNNRETESRSLQMMMDYSCMSNRGDASTLENDGTGYVQSLGIKWAPLYLASPMQSVPPSLHIMVGPVHVLLKIWEKIIIDDEHARHDWQTLHNLNMKLIQMESEQLHFKKCIQYLNGELHVTYKESEYIDESIVNNPMMLQLLNELNMITKQIDALKLKIKGLESTIYENNQVKCMGKYMKHCKLNEPHYWGGSVQGKTAYNIIKFRDFITQTIRHKNEQAASMFAQLLAQLQFIADCIWKKNYKPFDDVTLFELKNCIINFEHLFKIVTEKYGKNVSGVSTVKVHLLYHAWEYCQFTKCSPSWQDDQRIESMNQIYKKIYQLFKRYWNEKQLQKLVNYLLLQSTLEWDPTNTY